MGKRLVKISVLAIVLLYPLSLANVAEAGFYDWLVSKDEATPPLVNSSIAEGSNASFDKIFSWDYRKPENVSSVPSIVTETPEEPKLKVIKTYSVQATAYSSTPDQTDDTPFVTAKGTRVRDGIIAANFLPFNTKVRIPELYGDRVFVVEDRMNRRYWHNIDIWFPERYLALEFGVQDVTIEIVEES